MAAKKAVPHVLVLTPMVLNKRVRPAEISQNFASKEDAEKAKSEGAKGRIMSLNASKTFIKNWNEKVIVKPTV